MNDNDIQTELWYVVQNGRQIDIHYRSIKERRERTVAANLSEKEAHRRVKEHNAGLPA